MNHHLVAAKLFPILGAVMLGEIGFAPGSLLAQEANQQQQALAANTFARTAAAAAPAPPEDKGLAGLKHSRISPYELKVAGGGDPAKAPEALVAILGDSRLKHLSYVTAVTYSPNGKLLASADGSGGVRLWNPETGEEQGRFRARPLSDYGSASLYCLAFSPDGRTIAAGGLNSAVIFWDVASGRETRVLRADDPVNDLAFSPDGRLLATGHGHANEAQLWNLATGKLLHKLAPRAKGSQSGSYTQHLPLAFTPNGQTLFVGYGTGIVHAWDSKTGMLHKTMQAHDLGIMSLALSRDGQFLATGSNDKRARLWEVSTGRLLHTLEPHELWLQAIAFHPNGKTVATGCLDGKVRYWDIETGKLQMTFIASRQIGVESLAFSPDGKTLASAGLAARLWDSQTGRPRFAFSGHIGSTTSVAFSPDSRTLVTGGADGTVKLWIPLAQTVRQSLDISSSGVHAVAISPDGHTVASLDYFKPTVRLWDLATGRLRQTYETGGDLGEGLAFSPDGRWLAAKVGEGGAAVALWDLQKGVLHGRLKTWMFPSGSPLFSPDSKKVIIAGQIRGPTGFKSNLQIWDLATLRNETTLEEPAGLADLRAGALSPDGRTLALSGTFYGADERGTQVVLLWDLSKQEPRLVLDHAKSHPHYLDFAPDGRSIVTIGFLDAEARVWDPRDGKLRATIRLCEPGAYHIRDVRFAPDSRHFVVAMGNGTVYILRIQPPAQDVKEVVMASGSLGKGPLAPTELWKRLLGKPAPELQQIKGWIYGKPTRLADLRGRYVLLHFWNPESEGDMATLMVLQRMFGDKSFQVVVVCADYGGTVEGRRKVLAEREQYRWGGGELPFPFAMDGGGETLIVGTRLKTYGATHAAYGIVKSHRGQVIRGTNLLIDQDGKVVQQVGLEQTLARSGVVVELENRLGKQAKIPAVAGRFEQLYTLGGGEVLRRVAPPLPSGRTDYLIYHYGSSSLIFTAVFQFDGKLSLQSLGGGDQWRLEDVLRVVIKLKPYEFQASRELLDLKLPGDWVYRKDIPQGLLVRHLETILRRDFKQSIRLQERNTERDVIVVRGQFQPPPGSSILKENTLHFHDGAVPPSGGSPGTFQSVQELLEDFENIIHRKVINEAVARAGFNLRWQNHLSYVGDNEANTPAGVQKLKAVLENLSKQTGLEFKSERRKVPVWHFEKEK